MSPMVMPLLSSRKFVAAGLPRKLLRSRFLEVLHLSARKQGFRATRRDVVIETGNVGVEAAVNVGGEAKPQSIRTIAGVEFIGRWILIEKVQDRLIDPDSLRVHPP